MLLRCGLLRENDLGKLPWFDNGQPYRRTTWRKIKGAITGPHDRARKPVKFAKGRARQA